jgi:hypothetical protein
LTLKAYSFFHLNLAYSAIEEVRRPEVIEKCYWPLLRLARKFNLPFGIEASAWTLEAINEIDPHWVHELKELVTCGPCEFIGSGYTQIIGPLVPADVNVANLRIGMSRYEALLGLKPQIALVNEQAYSAGLVPLYREAGFRAIIMEWDNPARANPSWQPEWRYYPQYAVGADSQPFPVIWNKSVSFQKVQRFAHGELELDEYLGYIDSHQGDHLRAFPVYGNDVEVFDFRPGRYMTEAPIETDSEWSRLEILYKALLQSSNIELVLPSQVLDLMGEEKAGNHLHLESTEYPLPVKKQEKYNVLRWAVSGRDDLGINTKCWRIYEHLRASQETPESDWKELCYLWSSDFRTHITDQRWHNYSIRLNRMLESCRKSASTTAGRSPRHEREKNFSAEHSKVFIKPRGRFLDIVGERLQLSFNTHRGLALESFADATVGGTSLVGTLPHGFFDDIKWAADFYSGHLVFESAAIPKVTDLSRVTPEIEKQGDILIVRATINTTLGKIKKSWVVNDALGELTLAYDFAWPKAPCGSLRLGFITLNPRAFDYSDLVVVTCNGGRHPESFQLFNANVDHGAPVSFLISAGQALAVSNGACLIGDAKKYINLKVDKSTAAAVAMLKSEPIKGSYFARLYFSVLEQDDTSRPGEGHERRFSLTVSAGNR